ncbi:unnamed protein product [Boreogadus saida]
MGGRATASTLCTSPANQTLLTWKPSREDLKLCSYPNVPLVLYYLHSPLTISLARLSYQCHQRAELGVVLAQSRLNRDKEEKGIVAGQRLGTSASGGGPSAGLKLETFAWFFHFHINLKSTGDGASRQPAA